MRHFEGGGCSLGEVHAGPCVFKDVNKPVNKSQSVNNRANNAGPVNNAVNTCLECAAKDKEIAVLRARLEPKQDRKAYMREYMKRRRASN